MKKYITQDTEITLYDKETGMPSTHTKTKTFVHEIDKDEFVCTYFDYVKWMFNINSILQAQLLSYMAYKAEFNTGIFDLSSSERDYLMRELNVDTTAISRAIRKLVENNVIHKNTYKTPDGAVHEDKTKYVINPMLFWKGDMKNRKKLVVTFTSIMDDEELPLGGPEEVNSTVD